jgi:hypothetical protein
MTTRHGVARAIHASQQPTAPSSINQSIRAALRALFLAALATAAMAVPRSAQADDEWGINVYGFSYHFDRDRAHALDVDNEINPGVGVRYKFADWRSVSFYAEAGIFYDSGRNWAKVVGGVALWEVLPRFRIGGALALFHSDTYNRGDVFVAPVPLIAYDVGPATLNLTYFPKFSDFNDVDTLGFWVTFWPRRW